MPWERGDAETVRNLMHAFAGWQRRRIGWEAGESFANHFVLFCALQSRGGIFISEANSPLSMPCGVFFYIVMSPALDCSKHVWSLGSLSKALATGVNFQGKSITLMA